MHGDAVHDGVGPSEVNILEDARSKLCGPHGLAHARVDLAVEVDEDGFPRRNVTYKCKVKGVEGGALRRTK